MRRTALKIRARRETARLGRCFSALFGKPFGPGALLNLRPLKASLTSSGLVNCGSLAGLIEVRTERHVNRLNNCRDRRIGHRLKLSLQIDCKVFGFLRVSERNSPWCDQGGRWCRNSHHPLGHLHQRLVLGIKGFDCSAPLVVPPLGGQRPLQAVKLGFQSWIPGDLPLPP